MIGWSTIAVRFVSLGLLLFTAGLWAAWSERRGTRGSTVVVLILGNASLAQYLLPPLPDGVAHSLLAVAAWSFQRERPALGTSAFVLSVLVRPYLAPILIFIAPGLRVGLIAAATTLTGYFAWYWGWASQSTIYYYAIHPLPLNVTIRELPTLLSALPEMLVLNHGHLVLALPLLGAFYERRVPQRIVAAGAIVLVGLALTKGARLVSHPYYTSGVVLCTVLFAAEALENWPARLRTLLLVTYVVAGGKLYAVNWHEPSAELQKRARAVVHESVDQAERIVTYLGREPYWLFVVLREGTARSRDDYRGPEGCPEGHAWLLRRVSESELSLEQCRFRRPSRIDELGVEQDRSHASGE